MKFGLPLTAKIVTGSLLPVKIIKIISGSKLLPDFDSVLSFFHEATGRSTDQDATVAVTLESLTFSSSI